jgi:hypothetical protein
MSEELAITLPLDVVERVVAMADRLNECLVDDDRFAIMLIQREVAQVKDLAGRG